MQDIKAYKPRTNGLSSGQVLMRDYAFDEAKLVLTEMVETLCLDMVRKEVMTKSMSFYVGYSNGLALPWSGGTASLPDESNSDTEWIRAVREAFDRVVDPELPIRRLGLSCNNIVKDTGIRQLSLFDTAEQAEDDRREHTLQKAVLSIKERYGGNAMLKGRDLLDGATARDRNNQIGGHKRGK